MSTIRRQSSRIAAFLQAEARPIFNGPRYVSSARSQVWLGFLTVTSSRKVVSRSPQNWHGGDPALKKFGTSNALTLLVGRQEGHPVHRKLSVSSIKNPNADILVPANPGPAGK